MNPSSIRKKFLFTLLYFCEGAPIGFIWWMLPTQLRVAGVPIESITLLTSLLVLPWAFKFLWAPIVDTIQSQRWNLKSWIIAAQIFMVLTLTPLLFLDFEEHFSFIFFLLLFHTFSAATQDVAIDALCISIVPEKEQGAMNGWMQVGMLLGRSLFGGIALIAVSFIGMSSVIGIMIVSIIAATLILSLSQFQQSLVQEKKSFSNTFQALRRIVKKRSTWFGLAFAILGGIAYEGVGIVAGPFFVDRGITQKEIGFFFSFLSVGAMIIGAIIGGLISDRIGKSAAVKLMTAATAIAVLTVAVIDSLVVIETMIPLFCGMTLLYFTIGLFTSSTYALFMEITDKRLGATQFSTFMGGTNLCESLAGYSVGTLIATFNYPIAFSILAFVSLLSLPLINKIQKEQID